MSTYTTEAAQTVADMSAWHVASHADSGTNNAEAIAFWEGVRDSLAEAIDYAEGDAPDDDALAEIADNAPDVYNHTRMMEAIGTGEYLNASEFATGGEDMVTLAGFVLYEAAARAVASIVAEVFA
jgi:hypothetical protein